MFLDDIVQVAFPCLLVLFAHIGWTLLTIEGVPCEWLDVEVLEERFMLWIV